MKVRLWQRFWLLVVFLLLLAGQVAAHTISLVSVVYDPGSGTTTVTYRLTSGEQPALSHWVFEWCSPGDILGSNYSYDYGDDPFTGVRGIKYEQGFDDNEVRDVWFRLRGIWPMGSAAVGFKAATSTSTTTVSGPVCGSHKAIGTIGDYVWFDTDGDGVQDAGESGISGVQLQLLLSNGTHVGNATTDGSGGYLFTNLAAGNYKVDVTDSSVPSGYSLTTGNDPTSTISLASGQNYLDADFGYTTGTSPTGSIGDYVWHDEDGDGNQDSGESGIGSVTVNLKQGGSTIATQATSSGGGYDFTGLAAGTYVVDVDESTVPSGYTLTTGNEPLTVNLAAGQDYNDADFGYRPPSSLGSIGDYVWHDEDGDGNQDSGESGIGSVTVKLKQSGSTIATQATSSGGGYDFTGLAAGTYVVDVDESTLPSGYTLTTGNEPLTVNLSSGQDYNDADFGYRPPSSLGSIGDYVWKDLDRDGLEDSGEPGLPNITLVLYDDTGDLIATTQTDADGYYRFTDLDAGVYWVDVNQGDMPDLYFCTTGNDPMRVDLGQGEKFWDADFGFMEPDQALGIIGDYTWHDEDWDACQDRIEDELPWVMVFLYLKGIPVDSVKTDYFGIYHFTDLPAGKYFVKVNRYGPDTSGPGSASGSMCKLSPMTAWNITTIDSFYVDLGEGEVFLDADFGFADREKDYAKGRRWIIARYQPWYSDDTNSNRLRHWETANRGGQPDTCLFACYDSYDPLVWEYHILAAWACGIDGFAVDWYGRTAFENPVMRSLLEKAHALNTAWEYKGFRFEIAANYNEETQTALDSNFVYLGDSLMTHSAYWGTERGTHRPVFTFDVDEEKIDADTYRACADTTLPSQFILLWNGTQQEAFDPMDVCYPWVQPLHDDWDPQGLRWGEVFLDTTYWRINHVANPGDLLFALGGVWPGHDDREWSRCSNRFIDRQDTMVYHETWQKVHDYSDGLPMPWVYVETWNDFNQGTEIEPTVDYDYYFNVMTRNHARIFKSSLPADSVGVDNMGLIVPQHIHQARLAARNRPGDAIIINAGADNALAKFFDREHLEAVSLADQAAGIAMQPFTLHDVGDNQVRITWTAAAQANRYHVYLSSNQDDFDPCAYSRPERFWSGFALEALVDNLASGTTYHVAVTAVDTTLGPYANESWFENSITDADVQTFTTTGLTAVEAPVSQLPKELALLPNYPNPFNPSTTLRYTLPISAHVKLEIFDAVGRRMKTIIDGRQAAGYHRIRFDASDLSSGLYICRLKTNQGVRVRKLIYAK